MKGGGVVSKIAQILMLTFVVVTAGVAIASFFNISFATYGPYLVWMLTLGVFYFFLPGSVGAVFDPK